MMQKFDQKINEIKKQLEFLIEQNNEKNQRLLNQINDEFRKLKSLK